MAAGTIGKYERLDVLGHGTSGVVYLAWDTLLRRQVALKEIRAAGPEMERLLEEARVLDRLGRHPHIVEIHSVDTREGILLIDMELVRGRNLAELLRDRNGEPMPPVESLRIVLAVLDALAFAHERRILHRDVKPANILIGDDGSIKLTDFGLAEALGTTSVAGGGGTYPYMAPEDFAEDAASDYRSDLWAVGVVLYELLAGRRPFQAGGRKGDPFAWKRAIQEGTPAPLSTLRPDLPAALDAVLRRALAREKSARFPSARAFSEALQAAGAQLPASAEARPAIAAGAANAIPDDEGDEDTPQIPYTFAGGTVAYTLDELLVGSAKHWHEASHALRGGRFEPFLRAIGEVYIADLAAELRARGGNADQRLREFLERSRHADSEEPAEAKQNGAQEMGTIPYGAAFPFRPTNTRSVPDLAPAASGPVAMAASPAEEAPLPPRGSTAMVARWWFSPLFLFCLGPLATALASSGHMSPGRMGRFSDVFEAWTFSGMLAAMLLLLGIGARFPFSARMLCALPAAGGLIAAGAMVSEALGAAPTQQTLVGVAVVIMLPIAILLIEAATISLWRFWGWIVLLAAFAGTLHFAR